MRHRLANHDGAGFVQLLHHCRVEIGHEAFQHFGAALGRDALGVDDVLNADWDAVQGTTRVALRDLLISRFGLRQSRFFRHRRVSVHGRLGELDALERGLGQGD